MKREVLVLSLFVLLIGVAYADYSEDKYQAEQNIEEINKLISSAKHNCLPTIETENILELAKQDYYAGNYTASLKKLQETKLTYALEIRGEFNFLCSIKNKVLDNLRYVIAFLVFVGIISYVIIKYSWKKH